MIKNCLLITTWNRTPQLRRSLERLEQLTIPDEVLIVDDGGDDGCEEMVGEFRGRLPIRYIYTHNPGLQLCCHARNVGLRNTDAQLVIVSEPEIWFISDAVKEFVVRWWETREVVSAGIIYHAQEEWMLTPEQCNRIEGWVAPYAAIYEREALMAINGWNEEMPGKWGFDDIELLTRLRIRGIGQYIDKDIAALHQWHVNPGRDVEGCFVNDDYFKGKDYEMDRDLLVANQNSEWGVIKPRG